ncbi:MAG: hypothetical protein BWX79_03022 [Alphaproteobacteria bacterium ADurb.Bin100]|nr:MAG: hypothetical protein BWX79_03022 [Alphaproteobacteria bacterium ADurb.Bin100]
MDDSILRSMLMDMKFWAIALATRAALAGSGLTTLMRTRREPRTGSIFTAPMKLPTTASRPSTCWSDTEGFPRFS